MQQASQDWVHKELLGFWHAKIKQSLGHLIELFTVVNIVYLYCLSLVDEAELFGVLCKYKMSVVSAATC